MQFSYENEQFNPGFTWTGCFIRRFFSKLKNLRMKQPVQVNPGLNCSFSYENCIIMLL